MGFLLAIIIFFLFVWICVKAFSSNEKEIHVTRVDKETGEEVVEVRREVSGSAGKTAAQATLWIFVGIPLIILFFLLLLGS